MGQREIRGIIRVGGLPQLINAPDHIRIIIDNNPKIPDAILGDGESPLSLMHGRAINLERAGADLILCPCNTAHHWYEDLQKSVHVPIMHMIKEVASHVNRLGVKRVGLLATTGALKARIYHDALNEFGIEIITPDDKTQTEMVMKPIYKVKAGQLIEAAQGLNIATEILTSEGAEAIIAGCTEVPLVIAKFFMLVPLIDPASVLAEAAVRAVKGARDSG